MGRDLYEKYPIARQTIDEADAILFSMPSPSHQQQQQLPKEEGYLKRVMFEGPQEELTRTENAQPAILTISIALLRVLETEQGLDLKKQCQFALGHSLGEYSALVATRALSLADAVRLVVRTYLPFAHIAVLLCCCCCCCWLWKGMECVHTHFFILW